MTIMAIDPGPEQSAQVTVRVTADGAMTIIDHGIQRNEVIRADVYGFAIASPVALYGDGERRLVIEQIASMGMAVGAETFETCVWTGRFLETFEGTSNITAHRIPRVPIKVHLCGTAKAKDANIRQALIDRFGGSKALQKHKAAKVNRKGEVVSPEVLAGPLAGISSHCWSALALACCWVDRYKIGEYK